MPDRRSSGILTIHLHFVDTCNHPRCSAGRSAPSHSKSQNNLVHVQNPRCDANRHVCLNIRLSDVNTVCAKVSSRHSENRVLGVHFRQSVTLSCLKASSDSRQNSISDVWEVSLGIVILYIRAHLSKKTSHNTVDWCHKTRKRFGGSLIKGESRVHPPAATIWRMMSKLPGCTHIELQMTVALACVIGRPANDSNTASQLLKRAVK